MRETTRGLRPPTDPVGGFLWALAPCRRLSSLSPVSDWVRRSQETQRDRPAGYCRRSGAGATCMGSRGFGDRYAVGQPDPVGQDPQPPTPGGEGRGGGEHTSATPRHWLCVPAYDTNARRPIPPSGCCFMATTDGVSGSRYMRGAGYTSAQMRPREQSGSHSATSDYPVLRTCGDGQPDPLGAGGCPGDQWHSEAYLVRCLVVQHGWRWREPRVLAGPWPTKTVRSFMHPEGEPQP